MAPGWPPGVPAVRHFVGRANEQRAQFVWGTQVGPVRSSPGNHRRWLSLAPFFGELASCSGRQSPACQKATPVSIHCRLGRIQFSTYTKPRIRIGRQPRRWRRSSLPRPRPSPSMRCSPGAEPGPRALRARLEFLEPSPDQRHRGGLLLIFVHLLPRTALPPDTQTRLSRII